jgi:predicted nucleic acid-binding protein
MIPIGDMALPGGRRGTRLRFDGSLVLLVELPERSSRLHCTLDVTRYEVGNVIWKEHTLHKSMEEGEFREFLSLSDIVQRTQVLSVGAEELPDVADIAVKERITFYDASHIMVAKARNLTLATEDARLSKIAFNYTKTTSLTEG